MPNYIRATFEGGTYFFTLVTFQRRPFLTTPLARKEGNRNESRNRKGEAAVWQRRFWEHLIRNEEDFEKHFNYIHFNPVKHGYVKRPNDWKWSSFHRYVRLGFYDNDWGIEECIVENPGYFGE